MTARLPERAVWCWLGILLAAGLILFRTPMVSANAKVSALERKIADINLLVAQLADRGHQAAAARDALLGQKQELVAEISVLVKGEGIHGYGEAQKHPRIRYNLMLLGTLEAYMQALDAKVRLYHTGRDKLNYLNQLATDDIKMITTLNDLQIDALTTQISLVINRYLPEAHVIQIDPVRIAPVSPQQVWTDLFGP